MYKSDATQPCKTGHQLSGDPVARDLKHVAGVAEETDGVTSKRERARIVGGLLAGHVVSRGSACKELECSGEREMVCCVY